jgi:hypothetical protein
MNRARFDLWLRIAARASRRTATAGLVSAAVATFAHYGQAGGCRKLTQTCSQSKPCCKTANFNLRCKGGTCRCKTGFKDCNNAGKSCETNVRTHADHCGKCSIACGNGEACINGACTCAGGFGNCPDGCGSCGARNQDGDPVCFAGSDFSAPCEADNQCPIGSACLANEYCSVPCFA